MQAHNTSTDRRQSLCRAADNLTGCLGLLQMTGRDCKVREDKKVFVEVPAKNSVVT